MSERADTWCSWREAASVVVSPRHLKRTLSIALLVGSAFVAMNQLSLIVTGQATMLVWLKAGLSYLTRLIVSNVGVLSATRQSMHGLPLAGKPALRHQSTACSPGGRPQHRRSRSTAVVSPSGARRGCGTSADRR